MDRPRVKLGCAATLLIVALFASVSGCVDQGGVADVNEKNKPSPIVALTSEREFLLALARGVERGDFDDTDKMQLAMRRAAKNLNINSEKLAKPLNDHLGDLGTVKPLTTKEQRAEFATKLKAAAEALK